MSFLIYTDDHGPPHVHVTGKGAAKIALLRKPVVLHSRGLSKADTGRALDVVQARYEVMLEAWSRIHG